MVSKEPHIPLTSQKIIYLSWVKQPYNNKLTSKLHWIVKYTFFASCPMGM